VKNVALNVERGIVFRTVRVSFRGVDIGHVSRLHRRYNAAKRRTDRRNAAQWEARLVGAELVTTHERRGDAIRALVLRASEKP